MWLGHEFDDSNRDNTKPVYWITTKKELASLAANVIKKGKENYPTYEGRRNKMVLFAPDESSLLYSKTGFDRLKPEWLENWGVFDRFRPATPKAHSKALR